MTPYNAFLILDITWAGPYSLWTKLGFTSWLMRYGIDYSFDGSMLDLVKQIAGDLPHTPHP